jgi:hypothetical protein
MFGLSTIMGLLKSPKVITLVVLLLLCGSAWGYHAYKVGKLNSLYSNLELEHVELRKKYGELELTIEKARYANEQNLDTIQILRAERDTSNIIARNLSDKNDKLQSKYDKIIRASKDKKDAPVSEKLVHILNEVNGIKE